MPFSYETLSVLEFNGDFNTWGDEVEEVAPWMVGRRNLSFLAGMMKGL